MKIIRKQAGFEKVLAVVLLVITELAIAQNPVVQTMFTADPAPLVYKDTLFLFAGRDEEDAPLKSYLMREYRLFSTTDMVNWTDRGAPLRTSQIKWSAGDASAAQCIERNGKFYWYFSTFNKNSPGISIGVAVADKLTGPYNDVLGKALVTNDMTTYASHSWDDLDPTVFVDDDGQAYLFWGNNACYWVKLNSDMISLNGAIHALEIKDKSAFVGRFTEAPWVYKRNGIYYMIYAAEFPEAIHYSVATNIEGPWKAAGVVMPLQRGSNTNHAGVVDYKGNSYFFYHNDALPGGHSYSRSVAIEPFKYNADGTIPQITMSDAGVMQGLGTLNPYKRVEAETIAFSQGVKAGEDKQRGVYITSIHNNDYIKLRNVDFDSGPSKFSAAVSSRFNGGTIEIRIDSIAGRQIGILKVPYTGEWENWIIPGTPVEKINGVHDLYFVFKGPEPHTLFNFDYWQFEK